MQTERSFGLLYRLLVNVRWSLLVEQLSQPLRDFFSPISSKGALATDLCPNKFGIIVYVVRVPFRRETI
jgi:hypothetical protein